MLKNLRARKYLLIGASAAALMGVSAPSFAFSDTCYVWKPESFPQLTCVAGPVAANSTHHYVHFTVSPFATYWVRDIRSNVTVYSGRANRSGFSKTVFGLYSEYELKVRGVIGVYGKIDND